jgi:hypothetical protein
MFLSEENKRLTENYSLGIIKTCRSIVHKLTEINFFKSVFIILFHFNLAGFLFIYVHYTGQQF